MDVIGGIGVVGAASVAECWVDRRTAQADPADCAQQSDDAHGADHRVAAWGLFRDQPKCAFLASRRFQVVRGGTRVGRDSGN
jgi:hypothetical protein